VQDLVEAGYREVVLTGVQISDYRLEERESRRGRLRGLVDLIRAILSETHIERLRLTSIAPWDLDEELVKLFNNPRLCRHLHLSLQSGSDTVLRRMRRPYSSAQFREAVELARRYVPDVAITTDVIVGFPGESDVEFEQSLEFVEKTRFARVHVFPYSTRQGTLAASFPLHVSEPTKAKRAQAMQRVADKSIRDFAAQFTGRTLDVLFEEEPTPAGLWAGYTDNYVRVAVRSDDALGNTIVATRLVQPVEDGALGEVCNR
jgi:threonylcarbamoyladenosine tRNA methylthiotransferase MtaB